MELRSWNVIHNPDIDIVLSDDFHPFVEELRKNGTIPAISLGIVRLEDGSKRPIVHYESWGDRTEDRDPATSDTLFLLASGSKAFAAAALGILMDDFARSDNFVPLPPKVTQFNWETKVVDILPAAVGWSLQDEWTTRTANLHDILAHVSGLPGHDLSHRLEDSAEDVVRRQKHLRLAYELREKWWYCSQMYNLTEYIVSHYSDMSYPEFVTQRILVPLSMSSSTYFPSAAASTGLLAHTHTDTGRRIPPLVGEAEGERFATYASGLITSAKEMTSWLAMLLNEGVDPVSGKTVVPLDVYREVTTARSVVYSGRPSEDSYGSPIVGYGHGWEQWIYYGIDIISHAGGIPGTTTITAFSPTRNIGVVILTNASSKDTQVTTILKRVLDEVLGLPTLPASPASHKPVSASAPALLACNAVGNALSLPIASYTGTYSAPGYPSITLVSPALTSSDTSSVLADFAPFDGPDWPTHSLYGALSSVMSTHVRLQHLSGDTFVFHPTILFPNGYGRDTSAFETGVIYVKGTAEFVVDETKGKVVGFGMMVYKDAVEVRRRRRGEEVQECADAWFVKVS
ncbi:beta-lactamase/transpeptidase-like protein [Lentinus tigrinus ALCF2SS1-7]|uniref:Beta-lactamase/transpeptidase-like protein n=1 Tax=Lentinus tigrinus ALCF2SS1-6 TaxID=1328759 RepID=A0A5C2RR35_9APHY|nr:beta-lactamase/transpeptidase-like protein [Lentinus tigrinus ALCF2SS1-6]RPD76800.1 beta-lactamase/transpeptidase-like protein [Lentinus tigrinus ALCF2SS1-7]